MAETAGGLAGSSFVRLDRLGLHREILFATGQAILVGSTVGNRGDDKVPMERRRRRGPLQGGRFPRIVVNLLSFSNAPEKIDDERDLGQAHNPGGDGNWQIPVESAQ